VKHSVISYTSTLPLITKYFREQQDKKINTVLMFYNYKTRAVTIAFIALRNAVVCSNLRKLYYAMFDHLRLR